MVDVVSYVEMDIPLPSSSAIGSIPSVVSIAVTPSIIDPGVSIGTRASISVTFRDVPYPLAGSSFFSGSFWGKMRAHRRSLQGLPLRIIRGEVGFLEEQFVTEHYVVESLSRNAGDLVSITAKDLFKVADGDRSQAPAISHGRLLADIDEAETELSLSPSGIGNLEYPASGKVAIGGSEIVSFTRVGDVLTVVRAQSGTEAKTHDADEMIQLVLIYTSESPADIFYDLLVNYTEIDASWLPLADWQEDIDTFIGRLYSAEIAAPTPVKTLLDELIEQCGMVTWWDAIAQKVRLKSLRPVTGARVISTDEMMAESFNFQEQPNKRVSEVWTHFALRNPLLKLDDSQNYRSTLVTVDPDADGDYEGQPAIRKIFSRWIAINNRPAASRINALQLSRYRDAPRKFSFDLYITSEAPSLGQGLELEHWSLQDENGATITAPVQVTSIERDEDRLVIDAEEMLFTSVEDQENPAGVRLIIIDSNSYNLNLRTLHDSFYTTPETYDEVLCIIEVDVIVGSTATSVPAFDIGSWPAGVVITLTIHGRIQGKGGYGGYGGAEFTTFPEASFPAEAGESGGTALYTRYAITIDSDGQLYGGGGGGGGGGQFNAQGPGGGGGSGFNPGAGGSGGGNGLPGTTESGGAPGDGLGGTGGSPGTAGGNGVGAGGGGAGGAAGTAVDGVSFVTYVAAGTIAGSQIN